MSSTFSFSMNLNQPQVRSIAVPFDVHIIGKNQYLVQPATGGAAHRLDPVRLEILHSANQLATAKDHAWAAAQAIQHPNPPALVPLVDELTKLGLMVSEDRILEQVLAQGEDQVAPMESLFIRSSGRPITLERALKSLVPFSASIKRCVVIDDTRSEQSRAAVDRVLDAMRSDLHCDLIHFRRDHRAPLVQKLAALSGVDPERLSWFVDGPADRNDSYGCGINLALLLSAGQRMLMLDDDATLNASNVKHASPAAITAFPVQPGSGLPFGGHTSEPLELNPIRAHEQVLGRKVGNLEAAPKSVELAVPDMVLWMRHSGSIRLSVNGVMGDPGTRQPHWLFWQSPDRLVPWRDLDQYQQSLHERRAIRRELGPRIVSAYSVMTTTLTGIDNSLPMPPTLPFSVGEDTALGEFKRFTEPGSLLHSADWMLEHAPETPRHWTRENVAEPMIHNVGTFFKHALSNAAWSCTSKASEARMQSLSTFMHDLAQANKHDLNQELFRQTLEVRSKLCLKLETAREQWLGCDHVVEDIDQLRNANQGGDWHPKFDRPDDMVESIRRIATGYAEGLDDWLEAWQTASQHSLDALIE